jgi:hypothetical protein
VLLARSMEKAKTAASNEAVLHDQLALETAAETIIADLLLNGAVSRWSRLPAEGMLEEVTVRASAETGRLDINEADPRLIDQYLTVSGWDTATRALLLQELERRRSAGEPLRSTAELRQLLLRSGGNACRVPHLTVYSGMKAPDPAHAPPELLPLLAGAAQQIGAGPLSPGTAIRAELAGSNGKPLRLIFRIGGSLQNPWSISAWERGGICDA